MARPFRYTFILALVAVGTCLAALSGWRYARVSAPVTGPIVLVSIDALRPDRLSPYDASAPATPAIAALAKDGLVFDRAYSHVPQTLPAHAALLTGRLPFETGVHNSVGSALGQEERTLAEMLRDRGFATGAAVSSFLLRQETGIHQGFTFFDDDRAAAPSSLPEPLARDGRETGRTAERWIESAGTNRLFLFLQIDEPRGLLEAAGESAGYDERVKRVDGIVGQMVTFLKGHQLYEQATVILTADHGQGLGGHGEEGHGLLVNDDTLRVPLIIKPPSGVGGGRHIKELVQHVDIVPTVLDLAKAPIPGNLRGRTLVPLFDTDGSIPKTAVYSESLFASQHFGWGELATVTDGRFRYISAPREALYDHETDPREQENVIDTHTEAADRLRVTLQGFRDSAALAIPLAVALPVPSADRDRFEALGYVGTRAATLTDTAMEGVNPADHSALVEGYRAAARRVAIRDWSGAIDRFRALTHDAPENTDLWMHLATSASHLERLDIAVDAYQRIVELTPGEPDGYLGLAAASLRLRKFDDARRHAQRVLDSLAVTPGTTALAHELLARAALGRRDVELARAEARLAETANPARPIVAYVEGRVAFDQKRFDDALTSFDTALKAAQKSGESLADLRLFTAESLLALGKYADAEPLFEQELRDAPQSTRARSGLMSLYRATNRRDDATALSRH